MAIKWFVRFSVVLLSLSLHFGWSGLCSPKPVIAFTPNEHPGKSETHAARIDALMRELFKRGQFNGSILIVDHNALIYKNGFGVADMNPKLSFSPRTSTYLASLTKQFTAMGVMILVERHQLSYSDPLSKYFPQFPAYAEKITVRHLLNHTSGIPDYVDLGLEHQSLTNDEVLKAISRQPLRFAPGERFSYSNSGYVLLAMIIEKISRQDYESFLNRNIFRPLHMERTFVLSLSSDPAANKGTRVQPVRGS